MFLKSVLRHLNANISHNSYGNTNFIIIIILFMLKKGPLCRHYPRGSNPNPSCEPKYRANIIHQFIFVFFIYFFYHFSCRKVQFTVLSLKFGALIKNSNLSQFLALQRTVYNFNLVNKRIHNGIIKSEKWLKGNNRIQNCIKEFLRKLNNSIGEWHTEI